MLHFAPSLAFFTNPLVLGWLAAASAPLVIHLLSKRKYREVPWAAMRYLLAAMRKNSRRIQIEQWILLSIRTLLVVLLVLAAAEPFLEQAGLQLGGGHRAHKVLVIDGSYSMDYKPSDKTRFERAKELAARIVEESSQGDGFTLVLMGTPPRVVVGKPAFEWRSFLSEIEGLRMADGGADLPTTLAKVEEILKTAERDHPRLTRQEVFFLTDLGRNTWQPELADAATATEFRERSLRLGQQASLVVLDLGQENSENLAITNITTAESFATVAKPVTWEVELRNFGRQPRPQQLVELFVDGRRVREQHVDFEPEGRASVAFSYHFDVPKSRLVEVRLASDLLDVDNHRWASVQVKDQLRVLCVDGRPAGGGLRGATDYLTEALQPGGQWVGRERPKFVVPRADSISSKPSFVQVEVAPESVLLERDLSQYDAVFLANVGQFTASEAGVLESYLQNGGGLVFFVGDQVHAENYNRRLTTRSSEGKHVLPAALGSVAPPETYHFDPLAYRHPLIGAFRDQEESGLLTTPVQQYIKLELPQETKAQVALAFDSKDPAIVEERIGRGRSILVATSADVSWTAMPVWPSYLPIVQELLALAIEGRSEEHNVQVGDSIGGSLRTLAQQTAVTVRLPGDPMQANTNTPTPGETMTVRLEPSGEYSRWHFDDTQTSGPYVVDIGPPVSQQDTFAVNVDTAESDLTRLDPAELRSQVWAGVPFVHRTDWQDSGEEPSQSLVRRNLLQQWFLVGVLGLLLSETLLAYWFGRRSA